MANPNLSLIQNNILAIMTHEDKAMTKREIANSLGLAYQTVNNHMIGLEAKNYVVEAGRIANAMRYKLGDHASGLIHIFWRGEERPLVQIVKEFASGEPPVANLSQFSRELLNIFAIMYRISADTLDPDDPKPINIAQTKELQSRIAKRRDTIKQLLATYESLLDNDRLWDPRNLPTELIIKDEAMSLTTARDYAQNISERLAN